MLHRVRLFFQLEQPIGWIDIQPWQLQADEPWSEEPALDMAWRRLGPAQGGVEVPGGMVVRLRITPQAQLDGLKDLKTDSLQDLLLERSNVTDAELRTLRHLRGLRTLDLSSTRITPRGFQYLEPLEGLEHLAWSNMESIRRSTSISPIKLAAISRLSNLKSLKLSTMGLAGAELQHLQALAHLRHLRLSNISQYDEASWRYLAKLQTLETLGLSDGTLDEAA